MTQVPVAVGFGITTVADVQAVAEFADAVVVGSALVKIIGEHGTDDAMLDKVAAFTKALKQGCIK
jgi:tryptophan synthase alpha chain